MFKKGLIVCDKISLSPSFYYVINEQINYNIWIAFTMYKSMFIETKTLIIDNNKYIIISKYI